MSTMTVTDVVSGAVVAVYDLTKVGVSLSLDGRIDWVVQPSASAAAAAAAPVVIGVPTAVVSSSTQPVVHGVTAEVSA